MVRTSRSKSSPIKACESQRVSFSKRHSTRDRPSSVVYRRNSPQGFGALSDSGFVFNSSFITNNLSFEPFRFAGSEEFDDR